MKTRQNEAGYFWKCKQSFTDFFIFGNSAFDFSREIELWEYRETSPSHQPHKKSAEIVRWKALALTLYNDGKSFAKMQFALTHICTVPGEARAS